MIFLIFVNSRSVNVEPGAAGGGGVGADCDGAAISGLWASTSSIVILPRGPVPTTF